MICEYGDNNQLKKVIFLYDYLFKKFIINKGFY